jgi:hypothetical protein
MMPGHGMGITLMWRFCCCAVVLLAAPVLAPWALMHRALIPGALIPGALILEALIPEALGQSAPDSGGDRTRYRPRTDGHRAGRRHPNGLSARDIEPSRLGPAPRAFLYHCDAPAGFYPYIPACRTAWRIVPSAGHR